METSVYNSIELYLTRLRICFLILLSLNFTIYGFNLQMHFIFELQVLSKSFTVGVVCLQI